MTNKTAQQARALAAARLAEGDCTLVIFSAGQLHVFGQRGIKDLLQLLEDRPALLRDASLADKVVGRGAAALMILGGVKSVYTPVVSRGALEFLSAAGIDVEYGRIVPGIINRQGSGPCPVEELCRDCSTPEECLPLIRQFVEKMTNR